MTDHFIVRHGNTFDPGDTVLRIGARTDLPLSASGKVQAGALAGHFQQVLTSPPLIISGPLKRTVQTAELIAMAFHARAELIIDETLREIDYGPDEGQPEQSVIERLGQEALELWDKELVPPDKWQVNSSGLEAYWKRRLATMSARPTIYVTSSGIARFAQIALELSPSKLRTGALSHIRSTPTGLKVLAWDMRPEQV